VLDVSVRNEVRCRRRNDQRRELRLRIVRRLVPVLRPLRPARERHLRRDARRRGRLRRQRRRRAVRRPLSRWAAPMTGGATPGSSSSTGSYPSPTGRPPRTTASCKRRRSRHHRLLHRADRRNGNFSTSAPAGSTYFVVYGQVDGSGDLGVFDGSPDLYTLGSVDDNATLTGTLPAAHPLNVTVVRSDTGTPVGNADVTFAHGDAALLDLFRDATDAQGPTRARRRDASRSRSRQGPRTSAWCRRLRATSTRT